MSLAIGAIHSSNFVADVSTLCNDDAVYREAKYLRVFSSSIAFLGFLLSMKHRPVVAYLLYGASLAPFMQMVMLLVNQLHCHALVLFSDPETIHFPSVASVDAPLSERVNFLFTSFIVLSVAGSWCSKNRHPVMACLLRGAALELFGELSGLCIFTTTTALLRISQVLSALLQPTPNVV